MMKQTLISALVLASLSAPAFAAREAGDFIVRAGWAQVSPDESSEDVLGAGEFSVDEDNQLGLNFTYMLTDAWAIEVLAATPFKHNVSLGAFSEIAEVTHLPPAVMAQYYFGSDKIRPYVGAGINYTYFWDEEFKSNVSGALTDLELSDSWGLAAQVGIDYELNQNWLINASIWYLDIQTDVEFNQTLDMSQPEHQNIKTDIDPWVYMVSVGYKF
ncbi:outer membrane protein OmpW [Ferrimonas sediminicola]|uniref:Outer membrane protein W n=1 Tax=Ferrimonas sediminicola TaxID=2569538 RepID=A0A4U1BH41_9GAMM|nr:outer membrane protein OmpW [Ferrimonas sediminicola]TKB49785.1 outer membrane protein OmpW [Ferrimonas sediminicola]